MQEFLVGIFYVLVVLPIFATCVKVILIRTCGSVLTHVQNAQFTLGFNLWCGSEFTAPIELSKSDIYYLSVLTLM